MKLFSIEVTIRRLWDDGRKIISDKFRVIVAYDVFGSDGVSARGGEFFAFEVQKLIGWDLSREDIFGVRNTVVCDDLTGS